MKVLDFMAKCNYTRLRMNRVNMQSGIFRKGMIKANILREKLEEESAPSAQTAEWAQNVWISGCLMRDSWNWDSGNNTRGRFQLSCYPVILG